MPEECFLDIGGVGYTGRMRDKRQPQPKRIGLLLFNGITALDVAGPVEAFASARVPGERNTTPCYESFTIGLTRKEVVAESGLVLKPSTTLAQIAFPRHSHHSRGPGSARRASRQNRLYLDQVPGSDDAADRVRVHRDLRCRFPTGLLNSGAVTTHWRHADDLSAKFPALKVDKNARFGRIWQR